MVATESGPTRITVAKRTIEAWRALAEVLQRHDYKIRDLDMVVDACAGDHRGQSASGTYGIAVDVNWQNELMEDG